MINYTALHDYIVGDAAFTTFIAGGNDQQIADAINARTISVIGNVSRANFAKWAGATGLRGTVEDHAINAQSPLKSAALTIRDFLQGDVNGVIEMSDPLNQAMMAAWVTAGALTQDQANQLVALATTNQPVFGQLLHNTDIAKAFGRNGVESWQ